jgi:hypothetical protein
MRISSLLGLVAPCLIGCITSAPDSSESTAQSAVTSTPIPTTTGSFRGHYAVPVPPNLAGAATFAVTEVDWTVTGGTATLDYELPVGLVGGTVSITLSGALAPGATTVQLTSAIGSGSCVAHGTVVTCSEAFGSLGTLPISMAVVQTTATANHVPVPDAMAVANLFPSDPIGSVDFDLSAPADDDGGHGGGHGGGGGGHGPH